MTWDTPLKYRNLVIYQIYVRNHGPQGTFAEVEADLPRIRDMGVDIIYFMPIHPIGQLNKKGGLGCPYSIQDYEEVNPEYGTKVDFQRLVDRAHALGLKVMIDVVYNHTSHDSRLVHEHPEWFHQDAQGRPVTTVPEWSDVIDLKHPDEELASYLIGVLQDWVRLGVDGFRCDVASLLPVAFWQRARLAVAEVKAGVIWLAESVHAGFVADRRRNGLLAVSDSELYAAFDLLYDYDIWPVWQAAVRGELPVARYLEALRLQDCIYPANYVKMRCVENHDQLRIRKLAETTVQARAWTALIAFNKGTFFIYAGQEAGDDHKPSLFDVDKVNWGMYAEQDYLTRLARLKKSEAMQSGELVWSGAEPAVQGVWCNGAHSLYGVFNVRGENGMMDVDLPDGVYQSLLDDKPIRIKGGRTFLTGPGFVVQYACEQMPQDVYAPLLDYSLADAA
jgi:glycosidase